MEGEKYDAMGEAARIILERGVVSGGHNAIGKRFQWIALPKPWWWVFTFWKKCWENYGQFEEIPKNDPRFENAHYEIATIFKNL